MKQSHARALEGFDQLPDSARVRVQTVAGVFATSVPTVWRWTREGRLPAPHRLTPGTTAWRVGDLRAVLAGARP